MHDQIADMIIRIKNASDSKKESLVFSYSKMKMAILEVLQKEGFITSFESKKNKKIVKHIETFLAYNDGEPRIHGVDRVSKVSKRIYGKSKNIRSVKNGMGLMIISTPKGIMTDKMARKENIGGEMLFKIW